MPEFWSIIVLMLLKEVQGVPALIPIIVIPCSNFLCFTVGFSEFGII